MKSKLFTLLLAVAASVGTLFASTKIGDLYYNIDATNQTAEVARNSSASGEIVIPSSATYNSVSYSVTSIGEFAFAGCSSLTSVEIPNSVTSIGDYAFYYCSGLTSVTIGNSVTSIGDYAFEECRGLTSVTIGNSVTSIGGYAFYYCSGLTSVTIGNSVTSIGESAFSYCSGLTSVTIGNSVTSIGYSAFSYCSSLTSVTIGNSVTSIGDMAFFNCTGLTSVHISDLSAWCAINFGDNPLSYAHNLYLNGELVTDLVIPNSVTSIGSSAFSGCSGLTSLTIPNSVTSIGDWAFYDCSGLTSVTIEAETPPTLGSNAFYKTNNCPIYVPCNAASTYKSAWPDYANRIKYAPLPYKISTQAENGSVATTDVATLTICDEPFITCTATPDYGYHFTQWSDGNTDNPRTIILTSDTTFTAEFAHNPVITYVYNSQMGTVSGPTMTATGIAAENITFNATPNYGYHFVRWNDGNTDNPRTIWLSQDTTFTAEFAYDRVGTCGKDLALVWSYDPTNKVLTIGNAGSFTENMRFGVEAPTEMEELVIGNNVTAIGENAFAGLRTLKKVSVGESVKTIHDRAFYNCENLETIFNYRQTPANAYSTAFDGVDKFECKLYVLSGSIDMYKNASVWRDFYYTYAIGAEEATVTTNDVQVEPQDNAATITWPTNDNAATYTIEITKDGVLFCTLIFNADGQLTGIAFAPSRDGAHHAPAAVMTANGLQFTVTGLNSGTQYGYSVIAKNSSDEAITTYSGSFTTTNGTAIDQVTTDKSQTANKIIKDGHIFILRDGKIYTVQGQEVR